MRWNPRADVKEGLEYVSQVTVEPQPRSKHAQILLVCRGSGDDRAASVAVRQGLTLIGSRAGCRIRLRSANVAAQHCAIVRVGERLFLRDLASTSGTTVNGSDATSVELRVGDTIRIHRWEFDVTTEGQAAERAREDAAGPLRPAARVTVADAAENRLFETGSGVLLIGRNGRCDVTLQDGRASRAHALIFPTETGWSRRPPVPCRLAGKGSAGTHSSPCPPPTTNCTGQCQRVYASQASYRFDQKQQYPST